MKRKSTLLSLCFSLFLALISFSSCQKEEAFKNRLVFDDQLIQFDGVDIEFDIETDGVRINPALTQNSLLKTLTIDFAMSLIGTRVDLSATDVYASTIAEHFVHCIYGETNDEEVIELTWGGDFDTVLAEPGSYILVQDLGGSNYQIEIYCNSKGHSLVFTYRGECKESIHSMDLSFEGSANCYIVTEKGHYSFPTVKGNSSESVGDVASVEVLWESFGNREKPQVGELVNELSYRDGKITFNASEKKGNALIAAKDSEGKILWSWHIWMTDKPRKQTYNNNAGVMMDRNLGATSANPDDISSFGLLYQWGRKDPFRGAGELDVKSDWKSSMVETTAVWPDAVVSDKTTGTVEYALEHPMTFIMENDNNRDWLYSEDKTNDNSRWQSEKTIYDPCPVGWRVPDGGKDGIWAKAFGTAEEYWESAAWSAEKSGVDLSKTDKTLATGGTVWYPYEGLLYSNSSSLGGVLEIGGYWSVTTRSHYAYVFSVARQDKMIYDYLDSDRAHGCSVRCLKIINDED